MKGKGERKRLIWELRNQRKSKASSKRKTDPKWI